MIKHEDEVEIIELQQEDLKNVKKQVLVNPKDGFNGFMRMFIVGENGYTPYHKHDWYHLTYVVEGEGIVKIDGEEHKLRKGNVSYIPPGVIHGFKNTGTEDLKFLCLIPIEGGTY
ncbi:cupin domain-containing protein [candidate division WOR-3 bacterium]|nr:cupin domain-containing protein [candidate division WOR-3 bacterium]